MLASDLTMEEAYFATENIIHRLCWSFSNQGLDYDELKSVANLAFVEAYCNFDQTKSQLSTWIWTRVRYALMNSVNKQRQYGKRTKRWNGEERAVCRSFLLESELSEDAQIIYRTIRENIDYYFEMLSTKKRQGVYKYLIRTLAERGWAKERINNAISEFKFFSKC